MSDTMKVEPALSAEEWARGCFSAALGENPQIVEVIPQLHLLYFYDARTKDRGRQITFARPQEFAAVMALANHARPDGDPGKLTREDVADIRETADAFEGWEGDDALRGRLYAIAARIAALLPPRAVAGA